jgi:hypothetical protein
LKQNVQFAEEAPELISQPDWSALMYDPNYEETIRSYLQRPTPIATFTWDETDGADTILFEAPDLVGTWLGSSPYLLAKLQGFKYLRGDLEVQIRVNGNRFQYGQAIAAFHPLEGDGRFGISWERRDTVYSDTMCPCVAISPFMDNVATLKIPYAYPDYFLNLTSVSYWDPTPPAELLADNLGRFKISVLNPLATVNDAVSAVTVTVYCRMTNPIVTGFTNYSAGTRSAPTGNTPYLEEQGLMDVIRPIVSRAKGSTSSLPIVNQGMAAVRMVPSGLDLCRTDGADTSIIGAFHASNATTAVIDQTGHGSDMEFSRIFAKPNLISIMKWSSSDGVNTTISTIAVTPSQMGANNFKSISATASPLWVPDPNKHRSYLTHLNDTFAYWRGTLRYRIQAVASGFHSGRLMITWTPEWIDVSPGPGQGASTVPNVHQRYTMILDLQQETELFFEVPYVQSRPWLPTVLAGSPTAIPNPGYNGYLQFRVLNSLASSSETISAVQLNVWQYGGSDLEFAMPIARTPPSLFANALESPMYAVPAVTDQYGSLPPGSIFPKPKPDEGEGEFILEEQCLELPVTDDRAQPIVRAHAPKMNVAMGEVIKSVYDLVRRPSPARLQWGTTGSVFNGLYTRDADQTSGTLKRKVYGGSFMRYFQDMYLANRGSVRYSFWAPLSQNTRLLITTQTITAGNPGYTGSYTGEVAQVNNAAHTSELTVPYYSPYLFVPTKSMVGLGNAPTGSPYVQDSWGVVAIDTRAQSYHNRVLFMSAGKDYELNYLLPPQPVGASPVAFAGNVVTNVLSYYQLTLPNKTPEADADNNNTEASFSPIIER